MISSGLLLYSPGREPVSRARTRVTCMRMTGLNGILNTLHIRIYLGSNKSEFCWYEHTRQLSDVMTVIIIMMLL